jgi:hypothetical protein
MGISIEQYRADIGLFHPSSCNSATDADNNGVDNDADVLKLRGEKPYHWRETIPWKLSASLLVCLYVAIAAPFMLTCMPAGRQEIELIVSGVETNPGPTSITNEDDTTTLTGLIEHYENQDTKDIIQTYDPTHDWDQHVNQLMKCSVAKLRSASIELKIVDAEKTKKKDLAKLIVKRIQCLLPEICMYCETKYHVLPNDTPAICCYVCKQGIHMDCIQTELQTNNSTEEIFKIKGLVWICAECDAAQDDQTTGMKQKQNVQFKEPSTQDETPRPEVELQPNIIQNEEVEEETEPNRNNEREAGQIRNDPRNNGENPAICIHYKRGRCRHGIVGNGCMYRHPKPCRKLLNHGLRGAEGCHKGNE